MDDIWNILVVAYFIVMGLSIFMVLLKLWIPHLIFSIDEVCENKKELCDFIIDYMEMEMGVSIQKLTIRFDYLPNEEYLGYYQQDNHSITLCEDNINNVHCWILTIVEEIHHALFVSTKSSMKMYESFNRKVGYQNNPLEYSAKLYAANNFKSIHRKLKKQSLIRYKL